MRLLLDESVPAKLRRSLPNHEVRTVVEMGWSGVKNGKLLALAANQFEAFVTVDKNLPYQQNLAALPLEVVVLNSLSNELHALDPQMPKREKALAGLRPRTYVLVDDHLCRLIFDQRHGIDSLALPWLGPWRRSAMTSERAAIRVNARCALTRCAQARSQAQGIGANADAGFAIRRVKGATDATRAAHPGNCACRRSEVRPII